MVNLGAKRMLDKSKVKLWCVRHIDVWIQADEKSISLHYEATGKFEERNLDF